MQERHRRRAALALVLTAFLAVIGLAPKVALAKESTVNSAEELAAAASAAADGDTITLGSSFDTTQVTFNHGVTLDLGGHELGIVQQTGSSSALGLQFAGGASTVRNGTIIDRRSSDNELCGFIALRATGSGTSLTTENLSVQSYEPNNTENYNYMLRVDEGASLTLNSGTTVSEISQGLTWDESTYGTAGVTVLGTSNPSDGTVDEATATKLTVNDGVSIKTSSFAISGNGTAHNTIITINGGDITSTKAQGVYHPQYGEMNVNGGTITGETGIEIRSGELSINGGAIVGTGTPIEVEPNGNGSTSSGAGIAVAQHTTKLPISVAVNDGSVSGYSALYESNPQENDGDSLAKIELGVTGGSLAAINGGANPIASADFKNFVSGGSFSAPVSNDYISGDLVNLRDNAADGTPFTLVTKQAAESSAAASVTANGQTVYFAKAADAQDFANENNVPDDAVKVTTYTATLNSGVPGASATKVSVDKNDALARPSDPVRAGYAFDGWVTSDGTAYDFSAPVTGDLTLTGPWTLLPPTLTTSYSGDAFYENSTATISVTPKSDAGVTYAYQWYTTDDKAVSGTTGSSITVRDQGVYYVVVTATDAAGNKAEATSNDVYAYYNCEAMYRLYNPNTGEHFYTSSAFERDVLDSIGWNYEGLGWLAPYGGDPVYRLYNPVVAGGDHHYTTSAYERDSLIKAGWSYEGVGWSSADAETGVPLLREYNPNATTGTHNYTTSKYEHDHLVSVGWNDEGIAWYAVE